jgi:hypothetical protein
LRWGEVGGSPLTPISKSSGKEMFLYLRSFNSIKTMLSFGGAGFFSEL